MKQLFKQNIMIMFKNPNWQEANQLALYKHGFKLGTTKNKFSWRSGRDLNLGLPDYKSSTLTTWPPSLQIIKKVNLVETGQKSSLKGIHVHSFMQQLQSMKIGLFITCTNKAYNQAEKQDYRAICKMPPEVISKNQKDKKQ